MSTKNQKQQQQHVVATRCTIKLLLFAIPLALSFALSIVATLSFVMSSAFLGLFLSSPLVPNLSTPAAVQPSHPPQLAPVSDSGISTADKHAAAGPVSVEGERLDDDDELMSLAAAAPRAVVGSPKVAFLFLAKWDLPMAPLWDKFFDGHRGLYSVYVHTHPSFNASAFYGRESAFYGRHIPSKVSLIFLRTYVRASLLQRNSLVCGHPLQRNLLPMLFKFPFLICFAHLFLISVVRM